MVELAEMLPPVLTHHVDVVARVPQDLQLFVSVVLQGGVPADRPPYGCFVPVDQFRNMGKLRRRQQLGTIALRQLVTIITVGRLKMPVEHLLYGFSCGYAVFVLSFCLHRRWSR